LTGGVSAVDVLLGRHAPLLRTLEATPGAASGSFWAEVSAQKGEYGLAALEHQQQRLRDAKREVEVRTPPTHKST